MNLFFKKKQIKGYPKSFAKRLTWRIMLRMTIIMGIPMVVVFWLVCGLVTLGAIGICEYILKGEREEVRRITSDIYVASTNTAPIIEESLQNPDKVRDIINRMLKINPYMRSCGIYFVEGYYPQKGRLYAPYASRRDSIVIESQDASDQGNDYVKDQWFKDAIASKQGYWAKPFHDNDSAKTPLVSYLLPIRDKRDSTVAVMGVDLSLAWMNEKIQIVNPKNDSAAWEPKYSFYYYITDSTGTYLAHPDTKRIANEKIQHFRKKIEDLKEGFFTDDESKGDEYMMDGEKVLVNSLKVKYTDWTIAIVIPEFILELVSYVFAGLSVFFLVLGLLVVYFFGRRSIKKSVKPLQQLAMTADEVAKGNFNTALPEVNTHDEIHQLRDSFEQMQLSLKQYVADLREATAQKAAIENGTISMNPSKAFGGNLYTVDEYADFIYRFEFKLTPGANNGVGIRTPMEGDAAYVGMEIQILDCEHPTYSYITPLQHHGSVYGIIPAKPDHHSAFKPAGEWNEEEIYAKGDYIRVTVNGQVINEGNIREATKNGTADKQEHPGLFNKKGHIGFLGHGSPVQFRNIRIKELKD